MNSTLHEVADRLSNVKTGLANAISSKGIVTAANDSFNTMKENINLIEQSEGQTELEGTEFIFETNEPIAKGEYVHICGDLYEDVLIENLPNTAQPYIFSSLFKHDEKTMIFMGVYNDYKIRAYRLVDESRLEEYSIISDYVSASYFRNFQFDPTSNYTRGIAQVTTTVKDDYFMAFNIAIDHESKTFTIKRIPINYTSFVVDISYKSTGIAFDKNGKLYISAYSSISTFRYNEDEKCYEETEEVIPFTRYSTSSSYSIASIRVLDKFIFCEMNLNYGRYLLYRDDGGAWKITSILTSNFFKGISSFSILSSKAIILNDRFYMFGTSNKCVLDITDITNGIYHNIGPTATSIITGIPTVIDDRYIYMLITSTASNFNAASLGHFILDTSNGKYFKVKAHVKDYVSYYLTKDNSYDLGEYKIPVKTSSNITRYDLSKFSVKLTAELPTRENKERTMYTGYAISNAADGKVKVIVMDNQQLNTNFINIYDTIDEGMLIDEDMMIEEGLIFEDVLINDMMDEE